MTTSIWTMLLRRNLTWWGSFECEVMNLVLTDEGFERWARRAVGLASAEDLRCTRVSAQS